MARPRSFDRDAALDCALFAFWRNGYDQTSISDLTASMGINPPSLYAAFGDKQALFDEVVERYHADPASFIAAALTEPTARGAIHRMLHEAADEYTRDDRPRGCMALSEPRLGALRAESTRTLVARLQRGVDDGDLTPGTDVDALGAYFAAIMTGLSASARDGATAADLHRVADVAMAAWP